jgi:hypothetical protein
VRRLISLTAFPDWEDADGRLRELKARRDEIEKRMEQIRVTPTKKGRDLLRAQAEQLLATGEIPPDTKRDLRAEYAALDQERDVVEAAIEVQAERLERIIIQCGREACAQLQPDHAAVVVRIVEALWELGQLNREEQQLRDSITGGGMRCGLTPMSFFLLGLVNDINSNLCRFICEAHTQGYLPEDHPAWQDLKVRHQITNLPVQPAGTQLPAAVDQQEKQNGKSPSREAMLAAARADQVAAECGV